MQNESGEWTDAQFFDERKQDRGRANKVVRRINSVGRLTVLDVSAAEPELASFLTSLDKSRLRVQGARGECYEFVWASGYENGEAIRIQGVLEGG